MNIAMVILILMVALVGLGFVVNDDMEMHKKNTDLIEQITQYQNEISGLQSDVSALNEKVSGVDKTNADLEQQIDADKKQISSLEDQVAQLTGELKNCPASGSSSVQGQSNSSRPATSAGGSQFPVISQSWAFLSPALLIPLIVVTRKLTQSKKSLSGYKAPDPVPGMEVKSYRAILTKAEMDQVILSRRSR
jgi:TolA-binding protein